MKREAVDQVGIIMFRNVVGLVDRVTVIGFGLGL